MTFDEIKAEVKRLDPLIEEDSDSFKVAVILLSSIVTGPGIAQAIQFTGYDFDFVVQVSERLRQNKIWFQDKICCDWFDKEHGVIAFWCDVLCGVGQVQRVAESQTDQRPDQSAPNPKDVTPPKDSADLAQSKKENTKTPLDVTVTYSAVQTSNCNK